MSHRSVFAWKDNSCYMDSVLWMLFSTSLPFVRSRMLRARPSCRRLQEIGTCAENRNDMNERIFLEFQSLFRRMAVFFREEGKISDCGEFRCLYQKWHQDPRCSRLQKKQPFHLGEQNEAQEFLQFILGLYGMNGLFSFGATSIESFFYGNGKGGHEWIYDRVDRKQSIVWNIPYSSLQSIASLADGLYRTEEIDNVQVQHRKRAYTSIRTIHALQNFADLLILSVERIDPVRQKISHRRIEVPPLLSDPSGKQLRLCGILCHHGRTIHSGHYTSYAFFPQENSWYLYDNLRPHLKKMNSVEIPNQALTHGVLYFYSI